jgi:oligopeptide/dipeptide ABC transporter ATP-binding protein
MKLQVKGLKTYFFTKKGIGKAVDDISFEIPESKIIAIVGESGSGKTVTAYSILRLIERPGKIVSGEVYFNNINLLELPEKQLRKIRGSKISIIFQDPLNSLNPVFTAGDQITETILTHQDVSKSDARAIGISFFKKAMLPEPEKVFNMYPHQLSGGMRQRVMIAIALCCNPEILIADEPTTALDVSIQKEIIELIKALSREQNLSVIFITHDFRIVREIADEVIVMYGGKIVEKREKKNILTNPLHPYSFGLLGAFPPIDKKINRLNTIPGTIQDIFSFNKGCRFYNRCKKATSICKEQAPPKVEISDNEYLFCFHY